MSALGNLRTRRSMAVLLVVRDIGNPRSHLDVGQAARMARAAGYAVLMGNAERSGRESEYFDMLCDGHADGMILMIGFPLPSTPEFRRRLPNLPVVALEMIETWTSACAASTMPLPPGRRSRILSGRATPYRSMSPACAGGDEHPPPRRSSRCDA